MKNNRRIISTTMSAICMFILIMNAKESMAFASDALQLCVSSLIPSLFPFLFIAIYLNSTLTGCHMRCFRFLTRLCHIPDGSEVLLILGILGGYPVGAQVISNAYQQGSLKKCDAERMLGFCNNAGPSFIFGVVGVMFDSAVIPAILWLIQIVSAIFTGAILAVPTHETTKVHFSAPISITEALEKAVKVMGTICGWVILFRIFTGFIGRFAGTLMHSSILTVITGFLELTNGCVALCSLDNQGLQFLLSAWFLSFGGMCVTLQTASAASGLNMKPYVISKLLQSTVALVAAIVIQFLIFPPEQRFVTIFHLLIGCLALILVIILFCTKKTVAFRKKLVYN